MALSTPNAMLLGDGGAEQERLLRDEADLAAQFRRIQLAHVDAVQEHRAAGRIEQPRNQADQRALARSGVTHDGHRRAGRNAQVDPFSARPLR